MYMYVCMYVCMYATMSEASAQRAPPYPLLQQAFKAQCFNHSSNIDKNGSFPLYFVIFKSGFFPVLTCFEKYFILHNESIYCAPRAIACQKSSLAHPNWPFRNSSGNWGELERVSNFN